MKQPELPQPGDARVTAIWHKCSICRTECTELIYHTDNAGLSGPTPQKIFICPVCDLKPSELSGLNTEIGIYLKNNPGFRKYYGYPEA